jgi:hypothetical protein
MAKGQLRVRANPTPGHRERGTGPAPGHPWVAAPARLLSREASVALTYFTGGVRRAWPRRRGPECDARGRHQRQQQRLIVGPVTAADELQVVADAAASAERDPADLAPRSDLDAPIRPQKRTAEPVVVSVHHCETSARQRGARVVAQRRLGLVGQPELEIPAEVSRPPTHLVVSLLAEGAEPSPPEAHSITPTGLPACEDPALGRVRGAHREASGRMGVDRPQPRPLPRPGRSPVSVGTVPPGSRQPEGKDRGAQASNQFHLDRHGRQNSGTSRPVHRRRAIPAATRPVTLATRSRPKRHPPAEIPVPRSSSVAPPG